MRPTESQRIQLQDYLHQTLTYRETHEEIYDHILSAIEYQPENISFEDVINNVIRSDFGGVENLVKIEKTSKNAIVKHSLNKYLYFLLDFFKFPIVIYTILGSLLGYYAVQQLTTKLFVLEIIFALLTIILPGLIIMMRLFNTGYILDTTRKSARDKLFENLAGAPVRLFVILNFLAIRTSSYQEWISLHPFIITVIMLLFTVYNLALHKLYRHEFKGALSKGPGY